MVSRRPLLPTDEELLEKRWEMRNSRQPRHDGPSDNSLKHSIAYYSESNLDINQHLKNGPPHENTFGDSTSPRSLSPESDGDEKISLGSLEHDSQLTSASDIECSLAKRRRDWAEKGAAKVVYNAVNPETGETTKQIIKKGIKDFKFGEVIGDGSYSTVMMATAKSSGKKYAVKVLSKAYLIKQKKVKYVNIEKNALQKLNDSKGVIKLFFTFQDEGSLYFLLEYASNGDFLSLIKKYGSLDEDGTRYYGAQIIDVIEYLHKKGIIHRDIKPENILLDKDLKVKLTDFGTAKILEPDEDNKFDLSTRSKSFVGTAEYVSPELLSDNYTDSRCDIWSYACILFQTVAGKPPFKASNEYLTFQKVMKVQYAFTAGFPLVLRDLISRILLKNPGDRLTIEQIKKHVFFKDLDFTDGSIWDTPVPNLQPFKINAKSMQPVPGIKKRIPVTISSKVYATKNATVNNAESNPEEDKQRKTSGKVSSSAASAALSSQNKPIKGKHQKSIYTSKASADSKKSGSTLIGESSKEDLSTLDSNNKNNTSNDVVVIHWSNFMSDNSETIVQENRLGVMLLETKVFESNKDNIIDFMITSYANSQHRRSNVGKLTSNSFDINSHPSVESPHCFERKMPISEITRNDSVVPLGDDYDILSPKPRKDSQPILFMDAIFGFTNLANGLILIKPDSNSHLDYQLCYELKLTNFRSIHLYNGTSIGILVFMAGTKSVLICLERSECAAWYNNLRRTIRLNCASGLLPERKNPQRHEFDDNRPILNDIDSNEEDQPPNDALKAARLANPKVRNGKLTVRTKLKRAPAPATVSPIIHSSGSTFSNQGIGSKAKGLLSFHIGGRKKKNKPVQTGLPSNLVNGLPVYEYDDSSLADQDQITKKNSRMLATGDSLRNR